MQPESAKLLRDVLDCVAFLRSFIVGREMADLASDRAFRSAVERELITIGEALSQLRQVDPETVSKLSEAHRVIAFRHILVHGYGAIDIEVVWSALTTKLEPLAREVQQLLE